jgi:hypothetical protein
LNQSAEYNKKYQYDSLEIISVQSNLFNEIY